MHRLSAFLLSIQLLLAPAATLASADFPKRIEVGAGTFQLVGSGLYRKFLFKVYANALYLPQGASPGRVLDGAPRCLLFHYFREIRPDQFEEAARNFLEKNLAAGELEAIRPQLDRINALYRPVSEGDRYRLCYRPGKGTTLALNGELLGRVPGDRFADAYFSIWLGEESISNDLRDRLLGN